MQAHFVYNSYITSEKTMSVNVVRKGALTSKCRKCYSILEYSYDDIYEAKLNMDYLGDYDLENVIKCPVCKNEVIVD